MNLLPKRGQRCRRGAPGPRARTSGCKFRPQVELLEQRCVLSGGPTFSPRTALMAVSLGVNEAAPLSLGTVFSFQTLRLPGVPEDSPPPSPSGGQGAPPAGPGGGGGGDAGGASGSSPAVTSGVLSEGPSSGGFHLFPLPADHGYPTALSRGPDGSLWFIEELGKLVDRFDPASRTLTRYEFPHFSPQGIVLGPDGNVWVTDMLGGKVARITPDGTITEYALPAGGSQPIGIVAGPGGALWFTEARFAEAQGKIGRLAPDGTVREFALPDGTIPLLIAAGPDGNLWFTEAPRSPGDARVGRMTPDGAYQEFQLPRDSFPWQITAGPDGNLWLSTLSFRILRLTPGGVATLFAPASGRIMPQGLTAGPDGNVWFADTAGKIGKVTPGGTITEYAIPAPMDPSGITVGPDGNLWFVDFNDHFIGELVLGEPAGAAIENGAIPPPVPGAANPSGPLPEGGKSTAPGTNPAHGPGAGSSLNDLGGAFFPAGTIAPVAPLPTAGLGLEPDTEPDHRLDDETLALLTAAYVSRLSRAATVVSPATPARTMLPTDPGLPGMGDGDGLADGS